MVVYLCGIGGVAFRVGGSVKFDLARESDFNVSGEFSKMKQINMLLIMTLMLCGGCMSIYQRAVSEHKDGLYYPTIIEFAGICHLLDQGESDEPCDYLRGMSALSIPFIIDLPFTAAADTVCLPYDFFKSNNKKGEQNE